MYTQQSLHDTLFLMLYGGIAILALVSGLYLWLRRSNAFLPDVTPPRALRRWTAAFFVMVALSHVWWYVLGVYWLTDDRMIRNITAVTLDHILLVPLVMAILLRMLQNHAYRLWPWFLTLVPILVSAAVGIATHDAFYGFDLPTYWQLTALFFVYEVYFTNPGEMVREYLAQLETLAIIAFLLWRVETLQELNAKETVMPEDIPDVEENDESTASIMTMAIPDNIQELLDKHCVRTRLYLQHDLTLQQLATAIGTNRTYLSAYFTQQGITYNTYINRLRIDHFMRLYRESIKSERTVTAIQLAQKSGFRSYSTFATAFKFFNGLTVTAWMKNPM